MFDTKSKVVIIPTLINAQSAATYFTWITQIGGVIHDITFVNNVAQAGTVTTAPILKVTAILSGAGEADQLIYTGSTTNGGNLGALGTEYEPDAASFIILI